MQRSETVTRLYDKDVKENFTDFLRQMFGRDLEHTDLSRIHFGPTFLTTTRRGTALRMSSMLIDPEKGQTVGMNQGNLPLRSTVVLLAQNNLGEVIGYRHVDVATNDSNDYLEAWGTIATAQRGKGVAHSMEQATAYLLKVVAAKEGKQIYWHVENGNINRVKQAEEKYGKPIDPEDAARMDGIRQEQVRWQALYGIGGKLGFNEYGTQVIEPDIENEYVDFDNIDTLTIESFFGNVIITDRKTQDAVEIQSKKADSYLSNIKPEIEKIVEY